MNLPSMQVADIIFSIGSTQYSQLDLLLFVFYKLFLIIGFFFKYL